MTLSRFGHLRHDGPRTLQWVPRFCRTTHCDIPDVSSDHNDSSIGKESLRVVEARLAEGATRAPRIGCRMVGVSRRRRQVEVSATTNQHIASWKERGPAFETALIERYRRYF